MIQILSSYIILRHDHAFRCFLLDFRQFRCFAYDHHSRPWPLGRKENGKNVFFPTYLPQRGSSRALGGVSARSRVDLILFPFLPSPHPLLYSRKCRAQHYFFLKQSCRKFRENCKTLDLAPMQPCCSHVIQGKDSQDSVSPSWKGEVELSKWSPRPHPALTFHAA